MAMVVIVGLTALVLTLSGLGVTGYFLFTNLDTDSPSTSARGTATPNNNRKPGGNTPPNWNVGNQGGNKGPGGNLPNFPGGKTGGNPIIPPPPPPPPPTEVFDLRPVVATPPAITAPQIGAAGVTIDLGGKVGAVAVGGGGRYLVMHVHDRGQLKLFDVSKGEVTATVQVDTGMDIKVAAGVSRAFLYAPAAGVFRVYSLPDLQKVFDAGAPMRGAGVIAMGSRTDGPILMASGNEVVLADVSGPVREVEGSRKRLDSVTFRHVRAAPDGTAFALSASAQPNADTKLLTVLNRKWNVLDLGRGVPFPGPDGNFYGAGVAVDRSAQPTTTAAAGVWLVPAVGGETAYLSVTAKASPVSKGKRGLSVTVRDGTNTSREMVGFAEFDGFVLGANLRPNLMLDEHFFMVPEAGLLTTLTYDRTKLVLRNLK
jgi:hypothetical protein